MHDRVALFMVNTGLRPDEVGRIQFRDVRPLWTIMAVAEPFSKIDVRGVGLCRSLHGAFRR